MTQQLKRAEERVGVSLEETIMGLARKASIEINVQDLKDLEASRALLNPGTKVLVTFLPKQQWSESETACRALKGAGFTPVPHIPVRLLTGAGMLDRVFAGLIEKGQAEEVLLLSGDYPQPLGPYACVEDVLNTGVLQKFGLRRVSFAGHPEGHPHVSVDEIRRAERAKAMSAAAIGLEVSLVTQFFFEADPFLQWTREMRASGVQARLVGGLAGPTKISTLFKFAIRCGAGPSIRALGARPSSFTKLLSEHGPQNVLLDLAQAQRVGASDFDGIHMFCFAGFLRTSQWLHRVANGYFSLNGSGGFDTK